MGGTPTPTVRTPCWWTRGVRNGWNPYPYRRTPCWWTRGVRNGWNPYPYNKDTLLVSTLWLVPIIVQTLIRTFLLGSNSVHVRGFHCTLCHYGSCQCCTCCLYHQLTTKCFNMSTECSEVSLTSCNTFKISAP